MAERKAKSVGIFTMRMIDKDNIGWNEACYEIAGDHAMTPEEIIELTKFLQDFMKHCHNMEELRTYCEKNMKQAGHDGYDPIYRMTASKDNLDYQVDISGDLFTCLCIEREVNAE